MTGLLAFMENTKLWKSNFRHILANSNADSTCWRKDNHYDANEPGSPIHHASKKAYQDQQRE